MMLIHTQQMISSYCTRSHLRDLHESFNHSLIEVITEGRPTPATKHIELIQRVSVSLFVLNNTLHSVIYSRPFTFNKEIPLEAVQKAAKYVLYWESQKEIIVKVR